MTAPLQDDNWLAELAAIGDTERRYAAALEVRAELAERHKAGDKVAAPCHDCDGQGCDECGFSGGVVGEVLDCDHCNDGQVEILRGDQSLGMAECLRCYGQGRVLVTAP